MSGGLQLHLEHLMSVNCKLPMRSLITATTAWRASVCVNAEALVWNGIVGEESGKE